MSPTSERDASSPRERERAGQAEPPRSDREPGDQPESELTVLGLKEWELARVRVYLLLLLAAGGVYVVGLMLWPFLPAIVTSAVLATLVYPIHRRFEDWLGQRDLAALLGTIAIFCLVLVPLVALSLVLLNELQARIAWLSREAADLLAPEGRIAQWVDAWMAHAGLEDTPGLQIAQPLQHLASYLAGRTLALVTGLGGWMLQAIAALFTLFYLLRDAEGLMRAVKWAIPLDDQQSERLVSRAREVIFATVFGSVVIAVVQGVVGGLIFWAVGLPGAALWGTIMALLSFLPVVGPFLVWLPAAGLLFATGEVFRGIVLILAGALVISNVDNLLRPVLISGRAALHPLVVFFSILGGAFVFGAVGILVGPVLFVLALISFGPLLIWAPA
jgi:predicted PurR-regulated permease PerM